MSERGEYLRLTNMKRNGIKTELIYLCCGNSKCTGTKWQVMALFDCSAFSSSGYPIFSATYIDRQ